jgi:hypothetical protein
MIWRYYIVPERKVSKLLFFCHCEPRRWRRRDGYDRSNLLIDRGLLCRSFLTPRNDDYVSPLMRQLELASTMRTLFILLYSIGLIMWPQKDKFNGFIRTIRTIQAGHNSSIAFLSADFTIQILLPSVSEDLVI